MKLNLENYDKLLRRALGTFLLLAGLGAILVCIFVGYNLVRVVSEKPQAPDIVNINQNTKKEENLRLGYFQPLKGTDLFLIPLSEENSDASYSLKSAYSGARNYLVFNTSNKDSYWIWKSNAFLIHKDTKIHNQTKDEKTQKTRGLVFEFVSEDSNTDGRLNYKDMKSIQYFDLTSKKSVSVINHFDRSIGVQQTGDDEVLFFYSRNGKSFFKSLSTTSLDLTDEKEIGLPF